MSSAEIGPNNTSLVAAGDFCWIYLDGDLHCETGRKKIDPNERETWAFFSIKMENEIMRFLQLLDIPECKVNYLWNLFKMNRIR